MVSKPMGILSLHFFMKKCVGPGWALLGDAGLHIDPTPGRGITDAVRDAAALSEAIAAERIGAHAHGRVTTYRSARSPGRKKYAPPRTRTKEGSPRQRRRTGRACSTNTASPDSRPPTSGSGSL